MLRCTAVLDGHDQPSADDLPSRIGRPRRGSARSGPPAQEIAVQRVDEAIVHGAAGAIRAWPATWPPKTRWRSSSGCSPGRFDLDGLEIEEADEEVERFGHRP